MNIKHSTIKSKPWKTDPERYYKVDDIITQMGQHRVLVLLGEAKSGKTYVASKYLAQKWIEGRNVILTTNSHVCLRNMHREFVDSLRRLCYPEEKIPDKTKICFTFAKLGELAGANHIDKIPENSIIFADESGFITRDNGAGDSIFRLIKNGHQVILCGDIKQNTENSWYTTFVSSASNVKEIIEEARDKYYTEYLKYNEFGNYYDSYWHRYLMEAKKEDQPYIIRLATSPNPLHLRFNKGYEDNILEFVPTTFNYTYLFVSRELCDIHGLLLQDLRKKTNKNITKNSEILWGNKANKEGKGFGPIYNGQTFRIRKDDFSEEGSYRNNDKLKFVRFTSNGDAVCFNRDLEKMTVLPKKEFDYIGSPDCYTIAEFQGLRTSKPVCAIIRKYSLDAAKQFTINTRAEGTIKYVILLKSDNDRVLNIKEASEYLESIHDKPKLSDKFGTFVASNIIEQYNICKREQKIDAIDSAKLDMTNEKIGYPTSLKHNRCNESDEKISPTPVDSAVYISSSRVGRVAAPSEVVRENKRKGRTKITPESFWVFENDKKFNISTISSRVETIVQKGYNLLKFIKYIEYLGDKYHKRCKCWRSVIYNAMKDAIDNNVKSQNTMDATGLTPGELFVEFISLKYKDTPHSRWNKLPYLASICTNRNEFLSRLFGVQDIRQYIIDEILSQFDDSSFAERFAFICNKFVENGNLRICDIPGTDNIDRKKFSKKNIVENKKNLSEKIKENLQEYVYIKEVAEDIAQEVLGLHSDDQMSDCDIFYSSSTLVDLNGNKKTIPIKYGRDENNTFRNGTTLKEILKTNEYLKTIYRDSEFSWAFNIKGTYLAIIDVDGDSEANELIYKELSSNNIDPLREVSPDDPNRVHYFLYCPIDKSIGLKCQYCHKDKSKYKIDLFLPVGNHLIYRKNKETFGKDLPNIEDHLNLIDILLN